MKKRESQLTQDERLSWLRLIRSENVGPQTFHQLMAYYGSVDLALAALPQLAHKGGKKRIRLASHDEVMREFELADKNNIHFIGMGEADYPLLLRLSYAPPPLLAIKGNLALLREPILGIVGGRNASAVGSGWLPILPKSLARQVCALFPALPVVLTGRGTSIISGNRVPLLPWLADWIKSTRQKTRNFTHRF